MIRNFFWILMFLNGSCNNALNSGNNQLIKQVELNKQSLNDKALSLYKKDKFSEALKYYDSLVSLDDTDGASFFKRGNCRLSLFDDRGALADFQKSITYNYSKKSNSYLNIGVIYLFEFREYDSAVYYYDESLKLDPNNEKAKQGKAAAIKFLEERAK